MATTGLPLNIPLFEDTSQLTPIQTPFNALSSAINSGVAGLDTYLKQNTSIRVNNQNERNAIHPSPQQGARVFRADLGYEETYWRAYNATTNPGGAITAGWWPTNPVPVPTTSVLEAVGTGSSVGGGQYILANGHVVRGHAIVSTTVAAGVWGHGAIFAKLKPAYQPLTKTGSYAITVLGSNNNANPPASAHGAAFEYPNASFKVVDPSLQSTKRVALQFWFDMNRII